MRDSVKTGSMLWEAMDETDLFPDHVTSLIRIGEKTGQLPGNIMVVAQQEKKDRIFRSKLYSAMMYPAFVLLLTLIIGIGIAWFILPNLASVFSSLQVDLPLVTKWLIATGTFLGEYGVYVIPVFLTILFLALFIIFVFPPTKHIGRAILFRVPGTKKIIQQVELSRFGHLLGSLLKAGVVVTDSLGSLKRATRFPDFEHFYAELEERVAEGDSFEQIINSYKGVDRLIPSPVQGMIIAAENSGNLPGVLQDIGQRFEDKLETSTKNLTVMLEPILLFIVWIAVVGVALAVILPIYSLVGDFNAGGGQMQSTQPQSQSEPLDTSTASSSDDEREAADAGSSTSSVDTSEEVGSTNSQDRLEITKTGMGYLNVRSGPTTDSSIVAEVTPGDVYPYTATTDGSWYEIQINNDISGWVYGEYIRLVTENENED